jgi:hypothetical protein
MSFVACARCTALDVLCASCYQKEREAYITVSERICCESFHGEMHDPVCYYAAV